MQVREAESVPCRHPLDLSAHGWTVAHNAHMFHVSCWEYVSLRVVFSRGMCYSEAPGPITVVDKHWSDDDEAGRTLNDVSAARGQGE